MSGEEFRYKLTPSIVSRGLHTLAPTLTQPFWLPPTWKLPRYSFGDFHTMVCVLQAIAFIHYVARVAAARRGCLGMGYANSFLIMENRDLLNRLRRYTRLDGNVVSAIIHDLTYGECGIRHPDPALQPLIPLTPGQIALSPALFLGINAERNFTVLLNRLPAEKDVYSKLSTEREKISRQRVMEQLEQLSLRFWSGQIPGRSDLPDLDLAIVDDMQRTCLILELKAFIQPAEPREVLEKSKEIERGVGQVRRIRDAFEMNPTAITIPFKIDADYNVNFAVASETFVGTADVQDESIPVLRTSHLVRRLLADGSLSTVCSWLDSRKYLPTDGQHYEVREVLGKVGNWKIRWYGIKPLIGDQYL